MTLSFKANITVQGKSAEVLLVNIVKILWQNCENVLVSIVVNIVVNVTKIFW